MAVCRGIGLGGLAGREKGLGAGGGYGRAGRGADNRQGWEPFQQERFGPGLSYLRGREVGHVQH